ncbi:metal-dependent hydrolase [Hoyosella sp. YIM 151337]|uniref:metal-dependent hydrolase n=1 Tax=Hoyosella sp. YIM 151337 TaxID=2992742 RepID=UPI002235E667|nr:metal-dependent hydrolase [Hoyosella sp. YIM 151337]MCW4353697.1 metal-dependent hydrolase [Hoyosella sp. YIM 151337]
MATPDATMKLLTSDVPVSDNVALHARKVSFDLSDLPLHYVPHDAFATHVLNVLNLLLPAGEEWFVETFKEALPLIQDEKLREDVIGFMGQEAMHAHAHSGIRHLLRRKGIDTAPFLDQAHWIFESVLGERPVSGLRQRNYLVEKLAIIAALEHVFAFLGDWVLNADGLDRAGVHPTILDLLRWHGAEEVEHRMVAHETLHYFDSSYFRRARAQLIAGPVLIFLFWRGTRFLMNADPELVAMPENEKRIFWRNFVKATKRGVLPSMPHLITRMAQYFAPKYSPGNVGDTAQAVAYLASSPAAKAAEQ